MNFRHKMWAIPIAAAVVLGVGLVVTTALGWRTSNQLQALHHADYPYLEEVLRIDRALENMRAALQSAALEDNSDKLDEAKGHAGRIDKALQQAQALPGHKDQAEALRKAYVTYHDSALAATTALLAKKPGEAQLPAMQAALVKLSASLKEQESVARAAVDKGFAVVDTSRSHSEIASIAVAGLALLVLGLAARGVVSSVWRDLGGEPGELRDRVQRVAAGDLTTEIPVVPGDTSSLNAAVASMTRGLQQAVGQIRRASDSISTASSEIAIGNQDLSTRTENTAAKLQHSASELELISGTVRDSAAAAQQANQLATDASAAARKGSSIVSSVVDNMTEIHQASSKMSEIIGTIDGIAFQTNILALNAAVEAARAGEQGRGFAVVAAEVRTLAQRSAQAAKEIKNLIQSSGEKVESGTRLVKGAGEAMQEITSGVARVGDIISEISAAMTQQSGGIGQVNEAVSQLEQMTQQNAALVEESAAAAQSMQSQAVELVSSVATFKIG
ncbi:MAG: hypothetical protein RLZZ618_2970 [Pseudomonadota bacterium]